MDEVRGRIAASVAGVTYDTYRSVVAAARIAKATTLERKLLKQRVDKAWDDYGKAEAALDKARDTYKKAGAAYCTVQDAYSRALSHRG